MGKDELLPILALQHRGRYRVRADLLQPGIPFIKKYFELVIVAIIFISILPMAIEFIRARRKSARAADEHLLNDRVRIGAE